MVARARRTTNRLVTDIRLTRRDGVVAGVAAGFVASSPELINVAAGQARPWTSVRTIGTVFGYPAGDHFALRPVLLGGALHLGLSALYGCVFATAILRRDPQRATLIRGTAYGAAIYVVNFKGVTRHRRFQCMREHTTPLVEVPAHLIFGAALALILRRIARSRRDPQHP